MENHEQFKGLAKSGWLSASLMLGSLVLAVGVLYFGREVFIPIALAILLTFILAPVVSVLRRRGCGRTWSVIVSVTLTFILIGGISTVIFYQLRSLANDLPAYRHNISQKISDLRLASRGGSLEKVQQTVKGVIQEVNQEPAVAATNASALPVVVTNTESSESTVSLLRALVGPSATAGLVIVLVIFMLLRREDLRDRLIRLVGFSSLATTTKAIDEAGERVSKYLLRQFLVNFGFGVAVGLGFYAIGLPYAILWGVLAGVARFIPYAGPIMGAAAPILMSLAIFERWTAPLSVIGLMLALELITNMLVEPLVYGQSIGVSEVALLIMIAFWTWLWGAIGMVLAAPLTVCLMVISKSVPDLEFIGLLLSSEPALTPDYVFYQRLVAKDDDEAHEIVDAYLVRHSRGELYENLLIPALIACRFDHRRRRLTDQDQNFVWRSIRQIIEEIKKPVGPTIDSATPSASRLEPSNLPPRPLLIGYPAQGEGDELALMMLAELMSEDGWQIRLLSPSMLSAEALLELEKAQPAVLCIGCLPGGSAAAARLFCKRLKERLSAARIVLGCWRTHDEEGTRRRFAGLVNEFGSTLLESRNQLMQLARTHLTPESPPANGFIRPFDPLTTTTVHHQH